MKNDQVQALNYCAHAIDDLRDLEHILRSQAPTSAHVLRNLVDMLQHGNPPIFRAS
jgi:hypothetical protein